MRLFLTDLLLDEVGLVADHQHGHIVVGKGGDLLHPQGDGVKGLTAVYTEH